MKAEDYVKAKERMCRNYVMCVDCPWNSGNNGHAISCKTFESTYTIEAVSKLEQWVRENPVATKTNLMKLKEVFGETEAMTLFRNCFDFIDDWFYAEYKGGK